MKRHALAALALVACGDVYVDVRPQDPNPAEPEKPVQSTVHTDSSTPCPAFRPRENTSCSSAGISCEYGTSSDRACNDVLACADDAWERRPSATCFSSICPTNADVASLDGQPCALPADAGANDSDEAICDMNDGVCACTTGAGGADAHPRRWICVRPLSVCPPHRPPAGTSCSGGLWCDYGSCSFKQGLVMECENAVWSTGGSTCAGGHP